MSRVSGYRNHIKAEERAKAWKAASELVSPDMKRDGWVVALAGTSFLDRKQAERHGFKNVIGVDIDSGVVSHNTQHGRVVIHRSLSDTLFSWPDERPVAVVWADFCSNLCSDEPWKVVGAWVAMKSCKDAALFVNVLKGREFGQMGDWMKKAAIANGIKRRDAQRSRILVRGAIHRLWQGRLAEAEIIEAETSCLVCTGEYLAHKSPMNWALYRKVCDWSCVSSREEGREDTKRHIAAKLAWHAMRKEAA